MATATIRIPEDKKNILKAISSLENKKLSLLFKENAALRSKRHMKF